MSTLTDYVLEHTERMPVDSVEGIDLIFFRMQVVGQPTRARLEELLTSHPAADEVHLLDGSEVSYLQLGAWLGSQEVALRLMGLGDILGMWQLLSPRTVMGGLISEELTQQMAGQGYITVKARVPSETEA